MDWLNTLNNDITVVVPTRGLQHSLQHRYAEIQLAAGKSVWETPKICVWDDLIDQLYQLNKSRLGEPKALISDAQSFLIWQQVIAKSKKVENDLTLLNEPQTASAVQRSWKLLNKWQVDENQLNQRQDEDTTMFQQWCLAYRERLQQSAWIDNVQREALLVQNVDKIKGLTTNLIIAYFDLQTSNQRHFIEACEARDITVQSVTHEPLEQAIEYRRYARDKDEIISVLQEAKSYLEKNPESKIGVVIPDLSQQRKEVETRARQVFYPNRSPLENQSEDSAYRLSLGHSLREIPYISATLQLVDLLKPSFRYQDISYILRCRWLPIARAYQTELLELTRELKKSRTVYWSWEKLLEKSLSLTCLQEQTPAGTANETLHPICQLFSACIEFRDTHLNTENNTDDVFEGKTKTTQQWQHIFAEWLQLFDWHKNDIDSYHYQAQKSWQSVQETFISFDQVQLPIGLNKALQQVKTLCSEAVYLRQARNEPILVSGVLEAIGQPADILFITGMHENYPTPLGSDPFLPNDALVEQAYPFADQSTEFEYERKKLQSLMLGSSQLFVSYASEGDEGLLSTTALLRGETFEDRVTANQEAPEVDLVTYKDTIGEPCRNSAVIKGGAKIFENQSHCPFRAYIVHRVLYENEDEPEFGLDARDAGNVVHKLLENVWQEIGTSSVLNSTDMDFRELAAKHVDLLLAEGDSAFQYDRHKLLQLERKRLIDLIEEWLTLERDERYLGFNVIGKESRIKSEFAKIPINLVIDRVDRLTEVNQDIIVDYKTGQINPSDWMGERPLSPQLPLYAIALEEYRVKNKMNGEIRGIAFGKVKRGQTELKGFAGVTGVSKNISDVKVGKEKINWDDQLIEWRQNLGALAEEFISGEACVDPVKKEVCKYCDLKSVCRVHQLRDQTSGGDA